MQPARTRFFIAEMLGDAVPYRTLPFICLSTIIKLLNWIVITLDTLVRPWLAVQLANAHAG